MLITTQKDLDAFIAPLSQCPFITVDTEFLREKTYYPKLCLIQIGDPDKNAAAIDPLAEGLDLTAVYDLLKNENVLKVFHAARQDLEIFYQILGEVPLPFFDTQIAAMVCGYGDSVGYESLVRNLTDYTIDKSSQYTDWSRRPLTDRQIEYALGDVIYLVDIYQALQEDLEKRGRTGWVFEEEDILADPATYQNAPEESWQRIKIRTPKPITLAILRAVAAWREEKAQKRNIPRSWVLRDEVIANIASQAPKDAQALGKIRNFPKDLANSDTGAQLLELIRKAEKSDPKTWPKLTKKKPLPAQDAATLEILKMLLKVESKQNDVAGKLIASAAELEQIAMHDKPKVKALEGWRYEVFGRDALALKAGKLAIGLKDGDITKYQVHGDSELYGAKHVDEDSA